MRSSTGCSSLTLPVAALLCAVLALPVTHAATQQQDAQHTPFRIAGNLYYVGGTNHAAYLFATPAGLMLINSNFPDSPPLLRQSIERLGFKWADLKILLITHTHIDHAGGSAQIIKETGARYMVMLGDADVAESGGRTDYHYGDNAAQYYPPARVDRVLKDGERVELGGTVLTAHLTPGHTKGTTTWTFDVTEAGRVLHAVIIGGSTPNRGMKMIGNPRYPELVADYRKGFAKLRDLPCDLPLGSHEWYFALPGKYQRFVVGDPRAFIDPTGCKAFADQYQKSFEEALQKQVAAAP
jgi:metallo-beta-lactamase class B